MDEAIFVVLPDFNVVYESMATLLIINAFYGVWTNSWYFLNQLHAKKDAHDSS